MSSEIPRVITVNVCRNNSNVFTDHPCSIIVVGEYMSCVHKCAVIIVTLSKSCAPLHNALAILCRKLHGVQCPLIKIHCRRHEHCKFAEFTTLVCPCRVQKRLVVALCIVVSRKRYRFAVLINRKGISGHVVEGYCLVRIVLVAEDIKRFPSGILMCRYSKDAILHVVVSSGTLDSYEFSH